MTEIWIAFAVGLLVRWIDRAQYVVAEKEGRSWQGYLSHNWLRLLARGFSNAALFHYVILPLGWVTVAPMGFCVGLAFETVAESAMARAKSTGEAITHKLGNGKS